MCNNELIAILRGITPAEVRSIGTAIYESGWRMIEVPLNSPEPFESIEILKECIPEDCIVGAGTVVSVANVHRAAEVGASIIVSPNTNPEVIRQTLQLGLLSCPGVATISEAYTAVEAGARTLKLFPGSTIGISGMRAWYAALPEEVRLFPVGGVSMENIGEWRRAGAHGAGIGSALYRPGDKPEQVGRRARAFAGAWEAART